MSEELCERAAQSTRPFHKFKDVIFNQYNVSGCFWMGKGTVKTRVKVTLTQYDTPRSVTLYLLREKDGQYRGRSVGDSRFGFGNKNLETLLEDLYQEAIDSVIST